MNDKPTYEELENQIAELKKQNENLRLNSAFQNGVNEKHTEELIIANIELAFQHDEKGKRAAELIIANIERDFQHDEKEKRAAELIIANIELAFQNEEKKKRAAELINANIKLALQSKEKEKLAAELIIANLALVLQTELIIAKEKAEESERNLQILNEEFITTNEELRQTNDELIFAKEKADESETKLLEKNNEYEVINEELNQTIDELYIAKEKTEESEEKLLISQKKYSEIFEQSPIAIEFYDMSGSLINVNKACIELFGVVNINEVSGFKLFEDPNITSEIKTKLLNNETVRFEAEFNFEEVKRLNLYQTICSDIKMLDWYISPLINNNLVIGYIQQIQDITKRKNTELLLNEKNEEIETQIEEYKQINEELKLAKEKAEESEQKFKEIIYQINDGIVVFNEQRKIVLFNKGAEQIFGLKAEEVINSSIADIQYQFAPPQFKDKALIENVIKGIVTLQTPEVFNQIIDNETMISSGNIRNIQSVVFPIKFNKYNLFCSVFRDTTELKQYEQELIKAKEHAEESDRLKTAFLQNMSHEIRTPLNAISGFSGMLNKPDLSEEKRKSFVSIIQNSSKQLISIVSDILTISALETKQEKQNIDKICINNIIVDLLSIFKQQAQNQNISLYAKQQLSDKQSEIYTDKTKVTQIVTNLLTNALKFTHEGFIEFGYNLKDNELEFYVKDSGIGIKLEFHEKIFERFRQADKSINKLYGGTGLGLAISKAFAELLGGKIWVQSELEKGSTFYFTIPYKPVNEIDKNTTLIKQNENFKTVLVAEDEEYNFLFIEELLIDLDLKLIHAKDGQETVEIFKTNPNIDLILMDIKMPIMTGHEAAKIIKELNPNLPIVAQSAYALEFERAKYEGIFDDYLTKPINENDLKQMVMKYIDIQKKE